jgi:hypothetical protein
MNIPTEYLKFQIPVSKSQTNPKFQCSKFETFLFVTWILDIGAYLEFGA